METGGVLLNGNNAPARRVMFGMTDGTFNSFTADGQRLFGQSVDWAGDIAPIPEPVTLALVPLAVAGVAGYVKRRRSAL